MLAAQPPPPATAATGAAPMDEGAAQNDSTLSGVVKRPRGNAPKGKAWSGGQCGRLSGGQSGRTLTSRHFESTWHETGKEGIQRLQAQSHGLYGGQGEYTYPPAAARAPSWARLPDSARQTVANVS